jgi:hypothetical protein
LITAGIVIGWSLNQPGARLGERAERRRTALLRWVGLGKAEAQQAVLIR